MTLKAFREYILKVSGMTYSQFNLKSRKHWEFSEKLNEIGARNMDTYPPEQYPDIDATMALTPQEEESLRAEFYSLSHSESEAVN